MRKAVFLMLPCSFTNVAGESLINVEFRWTTTSIRQDEKTCISTFHILYAN